MFYYSYENKVVNHKYKAFNTLSIEFEFLYKFLYPRQMISIQWFECLSIPYIIISTVTEVLLSRVLLRGLKPCSSIASLSLDADDNEV